MNRDLLVNEHGASLVGRCGHCGISVDNTDDNHRVSSILRGGRGVECVLRGDLHVSDAAPLRVVRDERGEG